jgi:hypothetical protein
MSIKNLYKKIPLEYSLGFFLIGVFLLIGLHIQNTTAAGEPVINISKPMEGATYTSPSSLASSTISWGDATICEYSFDNAIFSTANCANGGSDIALPQQNGTSTLYIRAENANGTSTASSTYYVNVQPPNPIIHYPANGKTYSFLSSNASVFWSNASTCQYSFNGTTFTTVVCANGGSDIALPQQNGTYTLTIYAENFSGTSTKNSTYTVGVQPDLLGWSMTGQSNWGTQGLTATFIATGTINNLGLTRGASIIASGGSPAANGWGGRSWSMSSPNLTGSHSIVFGMKVADGYSTTIDSIDMNYRRSSTGPMNGYWEYQINGGSWNLISDVANQFPSSSNTNQDFIPTLDLSSINQLQNLDSGAEVNIRLTPYGATDTAGTFYIFDRIGYDLVLNGTSILAPVISNIAISNKTHESATITWTTNEPSTSQVRYGTTTSYSASTTLSSSLTTSHSVNLTGLSASTTYHYQVISSNSAGAKTYSSDQSFTTNPTPIPVPVQQPIYSSGSISSRRSSSQNANLVSLNTTKNLSVCPEGLICEPINTTQPSFCPPGIICTPTNATGISSSFNRDLTVGSQGEDVTKLQVLLNNLGYKLSNTGAGSPGRETTYFGTRTRSALSKFQYIMGIRPAVGYFGSITRNFINTIID